MNIGESIEDVLAAVYFYKYLFEILLHGGNNK